jgi:hypothetical protein
MHTSAAGFCCPVLATLDTGQPPIGDVSVLRALSRQRTAGPPRFNTWMLPSANPTYVGNAEEVGAVVARWADTVS